MVFEIFFMFITSPLQYFSLVSTANNIVNSTNHLLIDACIRIAEYLLQSVEQFSNLRIQGYILYLIFQLSMLQRVFDHDTFSADDIMGEAEIDLQPLITSAMAFGDAGMFGNMQIGKWLKSQDNALIDDSTVNIVDGKVKQEVSLKLQNVESGELEIELEWMPLVQ